MSKEKLIIERVVGGKDPPDQLTEYAASKVPLALPYR